MDQKVTQYAPVTSWAGSEILYLVQNASDAMISLINLFANIPVLVKLSGMFGFGGTHDVIANTGTASITKTITRLTNTGTSVLTLPNGSFDGQVKIVIMISATATTTVTGNIGNGSIAFTKTGDSAQLMFTQGKWWFIGGSATVS